MQYPLYLSYNETMKKTRRIFIAILIALGICCLAGAGAILLYRCQRNRISQETLEALRPSAEESAAPTAPSPIPIEAPPTAAPEASPQPTATPEPTPQPVDNPYRDGFLANEDMAAWLLIPDTPVDYPV